MSIALKYEKNASRKVLVEFTNGIPNESCEFHAELYEHENQTNPTLKTRRVLVVRGQHLVYIGNNWEEREKHPHKPEQLVTELCPKTRVVQVFDTDCFKMSPILLNDIKKLSLSNEEERMKLKKQLEEDDRSFSKRQDDLTEVFGSHKRKKAMTNRQRNIVDEGGSAAILKAVEAVIAADASVLVTDGSTEESTNILPYNKSADRPEDVYPLLTIFPENIFNILETEAEKFIRPPREKIIEWRNLGNEMSSEYVCSHAQYPLLSMTRDKEVYVRYACCLQLLVYMVKMFKLKFSEIRMKSCMEEVNETIRIWMFEQYTVGEGRNRKMPPRMKDKTLAHATILAWHIDAFSVKEETFISAFAISSKKFSKNVSALGGQFRVTGGSKVATLILPLKFPTSSGRARGR